VTQEGEQIFRQLSSGGLRPARADGERRILREKVRLCLNYAQSFHYRAHEYDKAEEIIKCCRDFVMEELRDEEDFQCFGTLAQINYYLGRVYRQKLDYETAERCFALSMENYYERAGERINRLEQDPSLRKDPARLQRLKAEELAFATYRSGVVLALGLGWMAYARGHLTKALQTSIIPARILLRHAQGDELSIAYIDLIYASILRALSGRDAKGLKPAIENALRAYRVFERNEHWRYMARAAFELSLAYFNNGELGRALTYTDEVAKLSEESDDQRWLCHSLVIRSRILRMQADRAPAEKDRHKKIQQAEQMATTALTKSQTHKQKLCEIDSRMTRGGVRIDLKKYAEARVDLEEALKLNTSVGSKPDRHIGNVKITAVCYLFCARSWALEGKGAKALEYFHLWKALEQEVEHKYVRDLASQVEREIEDLGKCLIIEVKSDEDFSYWTQEKKLRRFLIDQLNLSKISKKEMANKLGVSRQTLNDWEKELG
jgi:tetratricopeptide (TPR) repeat protein